MRIKSVFAMVAMLAIGTSAQAAFTFTIPTITPGAATFTSADGLVTVTPSPRAPLPTSGVLDTRSTPAGVDVNFADPSVATTIPAGTTLAETVPFSYTVTLRDAVSTLTGTFVVSGSIAGNVSSTGSILRVTNYTINPTSLTLAGSTYLISPSSANPSGGTAPNIGTGPGSLVFNVQSAVPEPASIALLGIGAVGALGLIRRRAAKA